MDLIVITMLPKYTVFTYLNTIFFLLKTAFTLLKVNNTFHLKLQRRSLTKQKTPKWTLMRRARGEIMTEEGSMKKSGMSTTL